MPGEGRARKGVVLAILGALVLGGALAYVLATEARRAPSAIESARHEPPAPSSGGPASSRPSRAAEGGTGAPRAVASPAAEERPRVALSPGMSAEEIEEHLENLAPDVERRAVHALVVEAETSRPVEGATVRLGATFSDAHGPPGAPRPGMLPLVSPSSSLGLHAVTDAQGGARLMLHPTDGSTLEALAPGFALARVLVSSAPGTIEAPVVLRLARAPEAISGVAIDRDARPVPGVVVVAYLEFERGRYGPERGRATTGPDGTFRLEGLGGDPEAWLKLRAMGPDPYITPRDEVVHWCPAEGRGEDAMGRPLRGKAVLVVGAPPLLRIRLVPPPGAPLPAGGQLHHAPWASSEGTYFNIEPDGRASIALRSDRVGPAFGLDVPSFAFAWLVAGAGVGREDPPEVEVLLSTGGRVEGRVVDAGGAAVAGADVYLASRAPEAVRAASIPVFTHVVARVRAGEDGCFSFALVPDGASVLADTHDGRLGSVPVDGLEPGATRRVEVVVGPIGG